MKIKMKKFASNVAAVGTAAMVATPAFAGELADAVTTALDKAELTAIGVAVLALCGVVALIRAGRRASGG